jgi:periplasmic protein TonB
MGWHTMVDLDTGERNSRRLWIFAGLMALALHLGGAALAVAHLSAEDGDGGLGANADEIAVELASPKVDDADLPLGPDTDQTQASQQLTEQKAETKEADLPKDKPNETEEPDRIVTQSNSKPKEEDQKTAALETPASIEQAQQETARKALDESAPEAEKVRAPVVGIGKDKQKLTADWGRKISAYFEMHKRFPEGKKKSAKVKVSLVLNRRGNVVSLGVAESSGDAAFDQAAISMIRRSDPVPRPPAALTDDEFKFTLDVDFTEGK